ncbi:MAG: 4Fe-4S binding protein [Thermodesulfobacteriota bacterium]|nr:4Fe-4S binding protein [Thermodesulfobacteriota bacterium]
MKKANLRTYRRAFQIFVALAFIIIPLLNRSRYSMVYGNFLSFHAFGIPFADPLAVLQLTIKNWYFTLDNFIGALLPLLLAFFLGTVFCSWVCPYGLLSELTQKFSRKVLPKSYKGLPFFKNGFPLKLIIFVLGFILFFMFSTTPILNQLSTAAWYTRFFQYYFGQDFISLCWLFLLGLLFIEFLAKKRLWCRYVCPQSILIILTKLINRKRLKVVFAEEKCICKPGYERCDMACTLSLQPKTFTNALETECSNCGDCVVACKKMGKALSFESPLTKALLPDLRTTRKYACRLLAVAVVGFLSFMIYQQLDFTPKAPGINHKLLTDKRIVLNSDIIENMDVLKNGAVVARGGQWPVNGSAGWQWQPQEELTVFKIIPDSRDPESYALVYGAGEFAAGSSIRFEQNGTALSEEFPDDQYLITEIGSIPKGVAAPATVDGRVVLYEYANQTYVLNLEVKDPAGIIKKIESKGDHVGMETMLTNVKKWINSPQITVSEGTAPTLPFSTYMKVIFHDGHTEEMRFVTDAIVDRTSEEFDDPWF